ncbi:hypothetical protein BDQ17DRAFT_1420786 [Cyathus striatus]|nr:hypothetical protein BDQ17DRAFT_1420786 [Cyathus striatus]
MGNLLLAVLEVEDPGGIGIKKGPDAGKEVFILKPIVGDEGAVGKMIIWREVAELWGGIGDVVGVKCGDVVLFECVVSRLHPSSSPTITASPCLKSKMTICCLTPPHAHKDLRLAESETCVRRVAGVVGWFERMAGLSDGQLRRDIELYFVDRLPSPTHLFPFLSVAPIGQGYDRTGFIKELTPDPLRSGMENEGCDRLYRESVLKGVCVDYWRRASCSEARSFVNVTIMLDSTTLPTATASPFWEPNIKTMPYAHKDLRLRRLDQTCDSRTTRRARKRWPVWLDGLSA